MKLADYRFQITEILQISGSKPIFAQSVCNLPPAKFLPHATRHLINKFGGDS